MFHLGRSFRRNQDGDQGVVKSSMSLPQKRSEDVEWDSNRKTLMRIERVGLLRHHWDVAHGPGSFLRHITCFPPTS